ncbi:MAG: DUF2341 domain-containing protein [Candidatus Pacebacteria bacterium]|nr:DUF2341 domain-containing protein [Candidatus Paceibacterota bacterium]
MNFFIFNSVSASCSFFGQTIPNDSTIVVNEDTLWCDNYGSIWTNVRSSGSDWNNAILLCQNLSYAGYGATSWILPFADELSQCAATSSCFNSSPSGNYWSSTKCTETIPKVTAISRWDSGQGCRSRTEGNYVRCRLAPYVDGACGPAARTYGRSMTAYSGAQCSAGFPSNTTFPDAGGFSFWTCSGINGGKTSVTCSAYRDTRPCVLSDDYNKNMVINGDRVWCDNFGNTWTRTFPTHVPWDDAFAVCSSLTYGGYGAGSWTLPSYNDSYNCFYGGGCGKAETLGIQFWLSDAKYYKSEWGYWYALSMAFDGPGGFSRRENFITSTGNDIRCMFKAPISVNGVCGSASANLFTTTPTTNLCVYGTASSISGSGPWTWTCSGSNGGTTASCAAHVKGACGLSDGGTFITVPATGLCAIGTSSPVNISGTNISWYCNGTNFSVTSDDSSCSALLKVDGVCGSANGGSSVDIPTTGLCNIGNASVVSVSGNAFNWTCSGVNGGVAKACSSVKVPPACGSANGGAFADAPTTGLCSQGTPGKSDWFDSTYLRRKAISISNPSGAALSDYQIKTVVAYDSDMQADFDDLRFTASDGKTQLGYWIESKTDSSTATVWVKVPSIPTTGTIIYMYYGNSVVATTSNGSTTFIMQDEFNGSTLASGWTNNGLASAAVTGGYLDILANASTWSTGTGLNYSGLNITGNFELVSNISWYAGSSDLAEVYLGLNGSAVYGGMNDPWADSNGLYFASCSTSTWTSGGANTAPGTGSFGLKITRIGSTVNVYQDGVLRCTGTYSNPITSIHLNNTRYQGYAGKTARFYNVQVRSFASAEPVVSFGAEDTSNTFSVTGPWEWYCIGGGISSSKCTATQVPPACGTANGGVFASAPTTGLCSQGIPGKSDWLDNSYSRRKMITITNPSGTALSNYQVKTVVAYDSDMQADFDDLRFTSSDGKTQLGYWIESKTDSSTAKVWVKVPSVPAAGTTIYMYYGNSTVTTTSNGNNTFVLFDDFNGASIDTAKWAEIDSSGNINQTGGTLRINNGPINWGNTGIYSVNNIPRSSLVIEGKYMNNCTAGSYYRDTTMLWMKDTTTDLNYPAFTNAFYVVWNNNSFYWTIYESGTNIAGSGALSCNAQYRIRQIVKPAGGAITQLSSDNGNTWSTVRDSSNYAGAIKVGFTHYDGGVVFIDDLTVRNYVSSEPVANVGAEEANVTTLPAAGPWEWYCIGGGISSSKCIATQSAALDAVIVSNTIPTTMEAGKSYSVNIVVRNTGSEAWVGGNVGASNSFPLGGVGDGALDSGKFGLSRFYIPTGTTINNGGQFTFSFTMTAPATAGTYNPQYRMVKESVAWFGQTHSSTITVIVNGACGTNATTFTTAQTSYAGTFCASGTTVPATPAFPSLGGTVYWACSGINGGTSTNLCNAKRAQNATCPAVGNYLTAPTPTCTIGTPGTISGTGPWTWTCTGINGGTNASCSANKTINGACGTNATTFTTAQTAYAGTFCASGTTVPATPAFPGLGASITWACNGINGGTSISNCSAVRANPITATSFMNPFDYADATTTEAKEQCLWCDYYYKATTDETTVAGKRGTGLDFGFTYSDQTLGTLSSYTYALTAIPTIDPDTVPAASKIQGTVNGLSVGNGSSVRIQGFSMTTGAMNSTLKQIPYSGGKTYDLWVKLTNNSGQTSQWIKSNKPFTVTDHKWPKVSMTSNEILVNGYTQFCSTAKAPYNSVKDPCQDLCWIKASTQPGVTDQEFSFTNQTLQAQQLQSSSWKCSVCYDTNNQAILCQNATKKAGETSNFNWNVEDPLATNPPYFPTFTAESIPNWWRYGTGETNGTNIGNPVIQFRESITSKAVAKLKVYGSECPLQAGLNSKTIRPIWIEK